MKKVIVGLYVRVSTQEQTTGYSLDEQESKLIKYAEAHDWIIHKVYKDPGYSGGSMNRPGLKAMIDDLNKLDAIIVYKLDRISRMQKDTLYLIEDVFLKNGTDFISMTEKFDTSSPFGKAMIGVLSVFAQLEREQIKERTMIGKEARAKDGLYHGGPYAPIGYDYVDGMLQINDYEAMQVRLIYDMMESGHSITSVVNYLNDHGYKNKYSEWRASSVRSVLTTPVYAGFITWHDQKYPGQHEPIIEADRQDKMISYLQSRDTGRYTQASFKRTSLLGGLIYCGTCGARYYTKQNTLKKRPGTSPDAKPQKYYVCYSRGKTNKRLIKDPNCKNKNYNTKILDQMILDEISKLMMDPDYIDDITNKNTDLDQSEKIALIRQEIEKLKRQSSKLMDLYTIDGIDFDEVTKKIQAINQEITALENSLSEMNDIQPELPINEAKEILSTLPDVLDRSDKDDLREIVHSLIDSIVIYGDDVEIHWKFC